jgi:hypothetical protein
VSQSVAVSETEVVENIGKLDERAVNAAVDVALFELRLAKVAEELQLEREDASRHGGRLFRYRLPNTKGGRHDHSVMIRIPDGREHCEFIYVGKLAAQQAADMLARLATADK